MSILTYTDGGFYFSSSQVLRGGGPGALIDLNFATGTYVGLTLSGLTVINSGGTAKTAGNAMVNFPANTPRITTLGLLVEPAATNGVFPTNMGSSWSLNAATLSSGITDLLGGTGAVQITDNATNSQHQLFPTNINGFAQTDGMILTFSAFGRAGTLGFAGLSLPDVVQGGLPGVTVNLSTGATVSFGTPLLASGSDTWTDGSNTWYRFFFTSSVQTGGSGYTINPSINMNTNVNAGRAQVYVGSSQTNFHWGVQFEVAQSSGLPTSLIPTTSGIATRTADQISFSLPVNCTEIIYTFSDSTTQTVSVTGGSAYTIPTNLSKPVISRLQVF